jgi:benzoyl-CoA reductase/2-hydroxyglutaryl-CoA dehydratase subunit BcrC/BadD/HgdB
MTHVDRPAAKIDYEAWNAEYRNIVSGLRDPHGRPENTAPFPSYLNTPRCFVELGRDSRLRRLRFDNSLAAFRLWSFLLSENDRLAAARRAGKKIVGVMKDLGTAPVIAYSAPDVVAFYPDGAWWIPCLMEMSEGLLRIADAAGFGDEVCPVRATLAAFLNRAHFPIPDLLVAAVGACCDDMSCVMQRVADLGIPTTWWELPYRRGADVTPELVRFVSGQLDRIRQAIGDLVGRPITDVMLAETIRKANLVRRLLARVRNLSYGTIPTPFPALETQICEMLALHFCSDLDECIAVLGDVLYTIEKRVAAKEGVLPADACRVVWVNPVADLRAINIFEATGGALAGTEYLFRHALVPIPEDRPPLEALAVTALHDPMIGTAEYRARLVIDEARRYGAEGVIVSAIPGASHSATEGLVIRQEVQRALDLPVLEISVPPITDTAAGQLESRFESFFDIIRSRRRHA